MRTISVFLQLIGLFVIGTLGYWTWYVNWGPNPNDRVGATVSMLVPGAVKDWGCGRLSARFAAEAPTFCSAAAAANPATPAPGNPPDGSTGGGRL